MAGARKTALASRHLLKVTERRFSPRRTALYGALWLVLVSQGWVPWIGEDPLARLDDPAASTTRKTSRDLAFAQAIEEATPAERKVLGQLQGSREEVLRDAIEIHQQLLTSLEAQGADSAQTRARLRELTAEANAPGSALASDSSGPKRANWTREALFLLASKLALMTFGIALAASRIRVFRTLVRNDRAGSPWSFEDGIGVFVRGDVWNRLYFLALSWASARGFAPALGQSPIGDMLEACGTLFAALPLLWLVQRHLVDARAGSWAEGFGLKVGVRQAAGVAACALALDLVGTQALGWGAWSLGLESSWAEGFDERLVWGSHAYALLTALDYVVWTPAIEEIAFRGVLYYSLRNRLGPMAAALTTAGLFAGLHFYSLPGFLVTAWSGFVWALAFERLRSVVPGIAAHAVYNLLYVAELLLLYR